MSADIIVTGTVKDASHIQYTTTRLGTTYSFRSSGRPVSIQLIRTGKQVEYRNADLPEYISPQLRLDLGRISKHFAGIK